MGIDFDPHRQAEAAMKEAAQADAYERQRWIDIAQAWLELARFRSAPMVPRRKAPAYGCETTFWLRVGDFGRLRGP
jgi:hypothetical protein